MSRDRLIQDSDNSSDPNFEYNEDRANKVRLARTSTIVDKRIDRIESVFNAPLKSNSTQNGGEFYVDTRVKVRMRPGT